MQEINNPKIEKQKGEIEKTKTKIAEYQAKQREQEKQLRALEDMEIVARFRSERISDEHYRSEKRGCGETQANKQHSCNQRNRDL